MDMVAYANTLLAGPPKPCSWCLQEMNLKPEPGSHGICRRHKAQLMAEALRLKNIHAVEDAMSKEGEDENCRIQGI